MSDFQQAKSSEQSGTTMIPSLARKAVLAVGISAAGYLIYKLWNKGRLELDEISSEDVFELQEALISYVVAKDSPFHALLEQDGKGKGKGGSIENMWKLFVQPPTINEGQTRAFSSFEEQQDFLNRINDCVVVGPPCFFKLVESAPWRNEMEFIVYDKHAEVGKKFIVVHSHFVGEDDRDDPSHPPNSYTDLWPSLQDDPFREDMMVWQVNIRHTLETEPRFKVTVTIHGLTTSWAFLNGVRV